VRVFKRTAGALLLFAALFWFGDYLALRLPIPKGRPQWETIRVDQVYTIRNRYDQVEWSRGNPVMEICSISLLPQTGHRPCWYVRNHTMRVNHLE
jgi:hypothetical protein